MIMKNYFKLAVSSLFLAFSLTVSAQLKVSSSGNVGIGLSQNAQSKLAVGAQGNSSSLSYFQSEGTTMTLRNLGTSSTSQWGTGLKIEGTITSSTGDVGVESIVTSTYPTSGHSLGVLGMAGNGSGGYNYGVVGSLYGSNNGAGIVGAVTNNPKSIVIDGRYAGYFHGHIHVLGNIICDGSVNGVLLNNYVSQDIQEREASNVLEKLSGLNVTTYNYDNSELQKIRNAGDDKEDSPYGVITHQKLERKHHAIIGEQLEEMFPELVYTNEDGTKYVNYTEMIPLLVQSINELQGRLATVENDETPKSRIANETSNVSSPVNTPAVVAKLAQNTPNPFTERTTIRFTLPEDVQNAYIYIFDMTGKMQKQLPVDASMQSIAINGYELSAGMYIYSLVVNGKEVDTKRMILSK